MKPHSINLLMEGPEANNRQVELSVYAAKVRQFQQLLASSLKERGREDVVINVVSLSKSSPAMIGCQPATKGGPDINSIKYLVNDFDGVESEKSDEIGTKFLINLKNLAIPEPKKIALEEIMILFDNEKDKKVYKLDEIFFEKIQRALGEGHTEINTIDGVLEEINIHGKTFSCNIYDAGAPPATIKCEFPSEMLEKVQGALGRDVFVSGEFFYESGADVPHKILVSEMEILPPSKKLPSLSDLKGIAPGLTGEKSPEEFVRELRDAWGGRNNEN